MSQVGSGLVSVLRVGPSTDIIQLNRSISVDIEFRQILCFIAIAETEHFGRASKRLRIAQPAPSRQVKLMEAEIGTALFERLPRGVRLTEAGRVSLTHARRLRAEMQNSTDAARAAAAGNAGHLRLGFIEVAGWHGLVPTGIRRFRLQFPGVRLSLSAMPTGAQLIALRQGQIDAALVCNPPLDDDLVSAELDNQVSYWPFRMTRPWRCATLFGSATCLSYTL